MNRDKLIRELRAVVGDEYVLVEKEDVIVYEQDGSIMQAMPEIVVLPGSAEEVAAVVRAAKQANVPIVPRGSGTGLAGGAVPAEGGVVISLARMNRILELDLRNRLAVVEPGVINQDVTKAVAADGFFYAPDPSSQADRRGHHRSRDRAGRAGDDGPAHHRSGGDRSARGISARCRCRPAGGAGGSARVHRARCPRGARDLHAPWRAPGARGPGRRGAAQVVERAQGRVRRAGGAGPELLRAGRCGAA